MQYLYSFHMPLMFLISGYFLKLDKPWNLFATEKAKRLLLPYAVCCVIVTAEKTLLSLLRRTDVTEECVRWIAISLWGCGAGTGSPYLSLTGQLLRTEEVGMLWFLLALFWGSLALKWAWERKCPVVGVILLSALGFLSSKACWGPASIQNGLAIVFWLYLGVVIRERGLRSRMEQLAGFPLALCIALWGISAVFGTTHLFRNYYGLGIVDVLGALAGSAAVVRFSAWIAKCSETAGKSFAWIGRNSLAFFAVHFWEDKIYPVTALVKITDIPAGIQAGISFFLIVLFCWGAVRIMGKIGFTKKVFGIKL